MELINCSFTNYIYNRSKGLSYADSEWQTDVPCYVVDWLSLLYSHIQPFLSEDQTRAIASHVVRQQIYDKLSQSLFVPLELKLKQLFPHSFLWKPDRRPRLYSNWKSLSLSYIDLIKLNHQIQSLDSQDLIGMENSNLVSICESLTKTQMHLQHSTYPGTDNEKFQWLENRNGSWICSSFYVAG